MLRVLLVALVLTLIALAAFGCAKYEFVIVQPDESAGRLTRQERAIAREPLVYHLTDNSNRLHIRIENPTDTPITLVGDQSYLVTPDGQSQPLRTGTIAPHTWAGFTVPPLVREYRRSGVSFGIGVGTWGGDGGGFVGAGYDPFFDDFAYLPTDTPAWQWKTGEVRMHLQFHWPDQQPDRFEHDWTIARQKVE
jgi:hypothetical protein